jgi:hypothetical protein
MPQVSLYLEDKILGFVRSQASENQQSVSKYVSSVLAEKYSSQWPDGYFSLFGAIQDNTFKRPEQLSLDDDVPRRQL